MHKLKAINNLINSDNLTLVLQTIIKRMMSRSYTGSELRQANMMLDRAQAAASVNNIAAAAGHGAHSQALSAHRGGTHRSNHNNNNNDLDLGYDTDQIAIFEIDKSFTDYLLCQICFSKSNNIS